MSDNDDLVHKEMAMTPEITAKIAEIERSIDPLGVSRHSAKDVRWLLTALADCQQEIKGLEAEVNRQMTGWSLAIGEVARWKQAIEGLTPSGSEYVNDPQRCAEYIRARTQYPRQILNLKQQLSDAATREAGKDREIKEMLETIAVLSDTPLVRKLVESDGILGDMLVVKEKRIVELEADLAFIRSQP